MTDTIAQIRSDVYDELFEMLRLPYSTTESVNDRAKRKALPGRNYDARYRFIYTGV